ncbi:MAG: phenylalanine--tRNA ligase subunit beta [Aeromicrobium sp.]
MRVPVSWLRELVAVPADVTTEQLAARLTAFDLKLEEIIGDSVVGPLVVGRVLSLEKEEQKNGKTINWCRVDVGAEHNDAEGGRGIVCGAHNFVEGDLVVVSLPGAVLSGGIAIAARKTYGHVSDGMICSSAELGLAGDASGIIVVAPGTAEVGDNAIELLGLGAEVLDLEVNPDRAYALSMRGVARDTALAYGLDFADPADIAVPEAGNGYPVRVEDAERCPVFTTRAVSGFDSTRPTPRWMAQRIEQAGMRSISLAVDVTNYVMLELGHPIHGFDRSKLKGDIVVRTAKKGETLTTLDGVKRTLSVEDTVVCDDRGPISLAGVMGGEDTELSETSTEVLIEAAHWKPSTTARTVRRHKLPSEASKRYERGVDPELPARATQRVAELLVEHGGGTIEDGLTVVGTAPGRKPVSIMVDLPGRVSGVDIDAATVVSALEGNAIDVELDHESLTAIPPSWRFDINDPYDLVEEVLRVVGYDKVPSVLPNAPAGRGLTTTQVLRRRVGLVLAGEGLIEVKTFPFAGPADWDRLGLAADDSRRSQVLLANPLSAEEPGMTTTLLTGLFKALVLNIGRGHSDVSIVETGRVFQPRGGAAPIYGVDARPSDKQLAALYDALPEQPQHVGFLMAGARERGGWSGAGRAASWGDAIAIVQHVADVLHVEVAVEQATQQPWHPGRCAAFSIDGVDVGHAGEMHPSVLKAYGLPPRVVGAEFDLDALITAAPRIGPRPDFSTYPVAKEDLAFTVDADLPAATLQRSLEGVSELIESVRLFDVYEGDQVPAGKKSLAFALRLRAPDRTLTDDEIKSARDAAITEAAAAGATLRS